MQWWFECIEKTAEKYVYAYSRECKDLDGIITYYVDTDSAEITKESASDEGSPVLLRQSLRHIYTVKREGFPQTYHVCCG